MNGYGERGPGYGPPQRRRTSGRRGHGNEGGRRPDPRGRKQTCPPELRDAFIEARDFLAGLIAALGLPARLSFGGVDPARDGRQITIDVRGLSEGGNGYHRRDDDRDDDGLAILIGKHGATLDALSAVTNAAMHHGESRDLFFAIDVEGYRQRRIATLRSIAQRCAMRVRSEGVALELEPMPPSERRIIHVTLAAHRDVATESTGIGSQRRVVIMPRGSSMPPVDEEEEENFQ
jgi:predicted RNA-binding protein Jag